MSSSTRSSDSSEPAAQRPPARLRGILDAVIGVGILVLAAIFTSGAM